jgi:hypothetical protein
MGLLAGLFAEGASDTRTEEPAPATPPETQMCEQDNMPKEVKIDLFSIDHQAFLTAMLEGFSPPSGVQVEQDAGFTGSQSPIELRRQMMYSQDFGKGGGVRIA